MQTESMEKRSRRTRLGKYEVVAHLATGGMGAVYKALDERGNEVALKVLSPELEAKQTPLERFRREAKAVERLRHPNIVAVYEYGKRAGTHYIAMEYVDGIDLHRYVLGKGPLKVDEVLDVLAQAARALHYAHEEGIVHRDIKPSNFLIARKGGERIIKLTDFGLALDSHQQGESHLTKANTTLGTVDYMSPEQTRGPHFVDARSDMYSLGCTVYFMLTGRAPFPEGTIPEKLYKHVHEFPEDPREIDPLIPDDVVALISRMMQKQREDRYQTMLELLADVEQLQAKYTKHAPDLLAALTNGRPEEPSAPRTPAFQHLPIEEEEEEGEFELTQPPIGLLLLAALALVSVIGLLFLLYLI